MHMHSTSTTDSIREVNMTLFCPLFSLSEPLLHQLVHLNTDVYLCPNCLFLFWNLFCSPSLTEGGISAAVGGKQNQRRDTCYQSPRVPCWPPRRFKCSVPPQPVGPCRKSKGLSPLSDSLPEAITLRIRGKAGIQPRAAVYTTSYLKHKHFI